MKITLNLPNQLTLGRLGLCVLFVVALSLDWSFSGTAGLAIFIVASLTDWLDGWIARKYHLVTDLGKLLDPLADKILISAAFVGLLSQNGTDFNGPPMWMVVVIIAREFLITGLRLVAGSRGYVMAADWAGKHKTITQIVYVVVSLLILSGVELELNDRGFFVFLTNCQPFLLWLALLVTVASGLYYFYKNRNLFAAEIGEDDTTSEETPPPLPLSDHTASTTSLSAPTIPTTANPVPPALPLPTFPAFKEWQVIVSALGQGRQSIILRKGGIAEGKSGFQVKHKQFWLLPTQFHQQTEKTKPEASVHFKAVVDEKAPVRLEYFAHVTQVAYLHDWEMVKRLEPFHFWREEVLLERYNWGEEKGLHCIMVRVYQVEAPVTLEWKPEYAGCKSWIEISHDFAAQKSSPILTDEAYANLRAKILQTASI